MMILENDLPSVSISESDDELDLEVDFDPEVE